MINDYLSQSWLYNLVDELYEIACINITRIFYSFSFHGFCFSANI